MYQETYLRFRIASKSVISENLMTFHDYLVVKTIVSHFLLMQHI